MDAERVFGAVFNNEYCIKREITSLSSVFGPAGW
jgi:hypothetical protein